MLCASASTLVLSLICFTAAINLHLLAGYKHVSRRLLVDHAGALYPIEAIRDDFGRHFLHYVKTLEFGSPLLTFFPLAVR